MSCADPCLVHIQGPSLLMLKGWVGRTLQYSCGPSPCALLVPAKVLQHEGFLLSDICSPKGSVEEQTLKQKQAAQSLRRLKSLQWASHGLFHGTVCCTKHKPDLLVMLQKPAHGLQSMQGLPAGGSASGVAQEGFALFKCLLCWYFDGALRSYSMCLGAQVNLRGHGDPQADQDTCAVLSQYGRWQPALAPNQSPTVADALVGSLGGTGADKRVRISSSL